MDWTSIALAALSAVAAIAVSWGMLKGEMAATKETIKDIIADLKNRTDRDHCQMKHSYVDRDLAEIKGNIVDIKEMLVELMKRTDGR